MLGIIGADFTVKLCPEKLLRRSSMRLHALFVKTKKRKCVIL